MRQHIHVRNASGVLHDSCTPESVPLGQGANAIPLVIVRRTAAPDEMKTYAFETLSILRDCLKHSLERLVRARQHRPAVHEPEDAFVLIEQIWLCIELLGVSMIRFLTAVGHRSCDHL